jgi:MFS family permease
MLTCAAHEIMSDIILMSQSATLGHPGGFHARVARRRRHAGYAWVAALLLVLANCGGNMLPVFRDGLQDYLGISVQQYGLILGAAPLLGVVSALAGGALCHSLGPVRLIRWGLAGVAGSFLLYGVGGRHWGAFLAAGWINGLSLGALNVSVNAYLARLFPRGRRKVLSLGLVAMSAGGIAFPLIAEGLLALKARGLSFGLMLHGLFLVIAIVLAAGSMLYRAGRARQPLPTRGREGAAAEAEPADKKPIPLGYYHVPRRTMGITLGLLGLMILMALHGTADNTLYFWMPRFLAKGFASPGFPPGMVLSAFSLAYLVSRGLLMVLPEGFGRRTFLVAPGMMGGVLVLGGLASHNYWLTAGGYVFGGLCWSNEYPALLSLAAARGRQSFGLIIAMAGALTSILTAGSLAGLGRLGDGGAWIAMSAAGWIFPLIGLSCGLAIMGGALRVGRGGGSM